MSVLDDLRAKRTTVLQRAQDIAGTAARQNRYLTADEQRGYDEATTEVDALDERIAELAGGEQRTRDAGAAFERAASGHRRGGPAFIADDDLAHAFRSALKAKNPAPIDVYDEHPRSWYQPGVEMRDTLTSTPTQAMRVTTYGTIMQHLVENSAVMAAGATVVTTDTGEALQVPKDTAFVTSALTAEGTQITESDPTLAVVTLGAYKYASFFQISRELADDTPTNLLSYLANQAAESLALAYGPHLITGTGTGQPTGVVTAATVGATGPTGTATSLGDQATAGQGTDLLYDLVGSLAEPYARRPSTGFIMRNSSLSICRKLKDSAGQPVAGMVGGALNAAVSGAPSGNNAVLGYPAQVDPNVAAMAADAKSIIFGDMSRYFVRIVNGIRFERSDDFAFDSDLVSFRCVIRLDGALVDTNAVKVLKNSST